LTVPLRLDFPHLKLQARESPQIVLSKPNGITTVSVIVRDIEKSGGDHSTRRTVAIASLKVGSFF